MSLAENVATLPQPRGDNYDSPASMLFSTACYRDTVLPWEDAGG
jgi:hypothetical protein